MDGPIPALSDFFAEEHLGLGLSTGTAWIGFKKLRGRKKKKKKKKSRPARANARQGLQLENSPYLSLSLSFFFSFLRPPCLGLQSDYQSPWRTLFPAGNRAEYLICRRALSCFWVASPAHLAAALALLLFRRHSLRAPLIVHECVRTFFNFSEIRFELPCDCAITCGRYLFLHRWCVFQCFLGMHVFCKRAYPVFESTCVYHCHSCRILN